MRVILTRHGETHENARKISMGQGVDGTLNAEGVRQAERLALRLRGERIDAVYVSDLQRAVRTALEVLKFHPNVPMLSTPELRERKLGIYEGRPNTEWKEAMIGSPLPFHAFRPQNGESYEELQERIGSFFNGLFKKHADSTVLLISHTGALTMLLLKILGMPITRGNYEKYKPDNTAITMGEVFLDRQPTIYILNSIDHLHSEFDSRIPL